MAAPDYHRQILALDDDELERFTRDWVVARKSEYFEVHRFAGAQDLGRDVVGFVTPQRHAGAWHNYQCKQFVRRRLPLADGLKELGKVLYFASRGEFTPPERYVFVAPYGISRPLEKLIDHPDELRRTLLKDWSKYCASKINKNKKLPLDPALRIVIESYDFSRVSRIGVDGLLAAPNVSLLHQYFGADPGPAPPGVVPADVGGQELRYIGELVTAYGERAGAPFKDHHAIASGSEHGEHLQMQRERFFDADSFKRFYRDNTESETLPRLEREIRHGIADVHGRKHDDTLERIDAVMAQAGKLQPGGPLAQHAGIPVKQGICHHFVNDGGMTWRKR